MELENGMCIADTFPGDAPLLLVWEGHLERHRSDQVLSEGKRRGDILWLGRGRSLCAAGHGLMRDGGRAGDGGKPLSLKSLSAGHNHLGTT